MAHTVGEQSQRRRKSPLQRHVQERDIEVHYSGSSRKAGQEGVALPIGTHYLDGSVIMISGPLGTEPAVAYRPTYNFT
jgi:hypothetical protein